MNGLIEEEESNRQTKWKRKSIGSLIYSALFNDTDERASENFDNCDSNGIASKCIDNHDDCESDSHADDTDSAALNDRRLSDGYESDSLTLKALSNLRACRENHLQDYRITVEYKALKDQPPRGVYLLPDFESLRLYYGLIFVHDGLYQGGIFKFKLELPDDYPMDGARPLVSFTSKVFHPHVSHTDGELDLRQKFPEWNSKKHSLSSVLESIVKMFQQKSYDIPISADEFANPNAVKAFRTSSDEFEKAVKSCVSLSIKNCYDSEPQSIWKLVDNSANAHPVPK